MKTPNNYGLIPLKKSSNSNTTHIFVNGFMSDHIEEIKALDWQKGIKKYTNPSDCKYIFHWDSGLDYTRFKTYLPFSNGILSELERATYLLKSIVDDGLVKGVLKGIPNYFLDEWKEAQNNSKLYANLLSQEIYSMKYENQNNKIYLYGHSLGTNLIKETFKNLYKQNIKIEKAFLFGGASSGKSSEWDKISNVSTNGIYNFYSKNDDVIKYLYRHLEEDDNPIGLKQISTKSNNIFNIDTSHIVNGHMEYKKKIDTIFKKYYSI